MNRFIILAFALVMGTVLLVIVGIQLVLAL
jgi:hypothetical protein